MIEEDLLEIRTELNYIKSNLDYLTKHLIPEKQDTKVLSDKVEHQVSFGDEPRHYKKCRRCSKKPCVCTD